MFNDQANDRMLEKISLLPDKSECIRLFSHLINCQYKWMARMKKDPKSHEMNWWDPLYPIHELNAEWKKSLDLWLAYIDQITHDELNTEVIFIGFDGGLWAAKPVDAALQLNYHSIHHRAQMQMHIRQQGIEPDFIDYISTKYRKISEP